VRPMTYAQYYETIYSKRNRKVKLGNIQSNIRKKLIHIYHTRIDVDRNLVCSAKY
jgi:hypothetical protein